MGDVIAFVGPSKSGKTMLMDAVLARLPGEATIIRSVTTRQQRDDEDALYYEFVSRDEFERRIASEAFAHFVEHAGNYYGTQKSDITEAITTHHFGVGAYVEQGVMNLRRAGFTPRVVKVIPRHYEPNADPLRQKEDAERDKIDLGPELIVENDFAPGGKEHAVAKVLNFLSALE